jgi:hypothetical protein
VYHNIAPQPIFTAVQIARIPLGFPCDSERVLYGIHEFACPSLIDDPTREPTVHMEKAYMPLSLMIDRGSSGRDASLAVYMRRDRNERLRFGTLPLMYVRIQLSKVVSVFVGEDVPVNASPSYP